MIQTCVIPACGPAEEIDHALLVLYHQLPESRRAVAIELVRQSLLRREISLVAARNNGNLLGAILFQPADGALGMIFPPQALPGPDHDVVEDQLVRGVLAELRRGGIKQCQLIIEPAQAEQAQALVRNGFKRIARLWCLRRPLDSTIPAMSFPPRLSFQPLTECCHELFCQTLEKTYVETLDCPELNGIRTAEEELLSHREHGIHDPRRWWLAWDTSMPVGVLMLTALPEPGEWELIYMGLVREARRRGFGRQLVLEALRQARAAGGRWLNLTMDSRNRPAWALYEPLGFHVVDEKDVFVAVLQQDAPGV